MMIDMYVISGSDETVCQACGKELLNLQVADTRCICGQVWRMSHCFGEPFARMELERAGKSNQNGNPYYCAGWLVLAI